MLILLATAYTAFASTTNSFSELVSREYTNPDPGNDPLNFFGYVPNNTYAIISIGTLVYALIDSPPLRSVLML